VSIHLAKRVPLPRNNSRLPLRRHSDAHRAHRRHSEPPVAGRREPLHLEAGGVDSALAEDVDDIGDAGRCGDLDSAGAEGVFFPAHRYHVFADGLAFDQNE